MIDLLPVAWSDIAYGLDRVLNTPIIADPDESYAAISLLRVLLVGTTCLAIHRVIGMLKALPKRRDDQTWGHYFSNPWWRTPAILVTVGLILSTLMICLQIGARNPDNNVSRLANLTWYLAIVYSGMWLTALGSAIMAGEFRARMRSDA